MRKIHRLILKLGIAFGLLITLLLGVGWLGLRWMSRMDAGFENTPSARLAFACSATPRRMTCLARTCTT